ncbi:MAG: hypothetical protein IIZ35_05740, partial [Clostridia bacterium]|nr:hypothetical protein [Clostridia bacterium]
MDLSLRRIELLYETLDASAVHEVVYPVSVLDVRRLALGSFVASEIEVSLLSDVVGSLGEVFVEFFPVVILGNFLFDLFLGLRAERILFDFFSLVCDDDPDPRVEERLLAQTRQKRLDVKFRRVGENVRVGLESDRKTVPSVRGTDAFKRLRDISLFEFDRVSLTLVAVVDLEPERQGVDDRRADAVQTARDLVALAAELTAGVKDREDDLEG